MAQLERHRERARARAEGYWRAWSRGIRRNLDEGELYALGHLNGTMSTYINR
jgi:hypothetical protein